MFRIVIAIQREGLHGSTVQRISLRLIGQELFAGGKKSHTQNNCL